VRIVAHTEARNCSREGRHLSAAAVISTILITVGIAISRKRDEAYPLVPGTTDLIRGLTHIRKSNGAVEIAEIPMHPQSGNIIN
jgi:hypothetical protein